MPLNIQYHTPAAVTDKAQPTNVFTVNQMVGGSSQLPIMSSELFPHFDLFTPRSAVAGNEEPSEDWFHDIVNTQLSVEL